MFVSQSMQDVRTCFIYFCLSFLMFGDLAVMKQILELKGSLHSPAGLSLSFNSPVALFSRPVANVLLLSWVKSINHRYM